MVFDMKKLLLIIIIIVANSHLNAQELVTDRPDQTESSAIVPLNSLQIETGFVSVQDESDTYELNATTFNTTLFRYGLLKNLELRLGFEYNSEEIKNKISDNSIKTQGFSPLYTGIKVKINKEDKWKPDVAILAGINLPFTAHKDFKPEFAASDVRLAFAHTLSDNISTGYNIGMQYDGFTSVPFYFYSLAFGISITERLGTFLEVYGITNKVTKPENLYDFGFTYLVIDNLQIDLSGGLGLNDNAIDNFISFGFSLRVPN